jgi:hypothetical protein
MASKHKLIFAVEGSGGQSTANVTAGWSVSFYINANDESSAIATGKASRMQLLLRGMMSEFYAIPFVRIQQTADNGAPTRATFVYSFPVSVRDGLLPYLASSRTNPPPDSFDALNIRLQTVAGPHRTFLLRGVPDDVCEGGGAYVPTSAFNAAFQLFRAAVITNNDNWAMRQQAGGTPYSISDIDVSTRSLAVSPQVTIICPAGTFAPNDPVRLSPTPAFPGLGGLWNVSTITADVANAVVLRLKPKRGHQVGLSLVYALPSTIRKVTYALVNLADAQPISGTHKLTGRPFGLQRGRRKRTA